MPRSNSAKYSRARRTSEPPMLLRLRSTLSARTLRRKPRSATSWRSELTIVTRSSSYFLRRARKARPRSLLVLERLTTTVVSRASSSSSCCCLGARWLEGGDQSAPMRPRIMASQSCGRGWPPRLKRALGTSRPRPPSNARMRTSSGIGGWSGRDCGWQRMSSSVTSLTQQPLVLHAALS